MTRTGRTLRRADLIAVVFLGGCVGGYARFAIAQAWITSRYGFPWPIFAVNVAGAFFLALVVVGASDIRPGRYLRPLLGTGFCGAFTTFSTVVVAVARLAAHDHVATAAVYLAATTAAGLAAAVAGLVLGRAAASKLRPVH